MKKKIDDNIFVSIRIRPFSKDEDNRTTPLSIEKNQIKSNIPLIEI
jgi:hypothetical protein